LALTLAALLTACSSSSQPATGFAYTGPTTLNIRGDLELRAATTATVRHGERLEILETRRRFVKVRTSAGAVGWTDSAYLLTQAQMDDLNRLAESAARLPSLGAATVFDTLNVHTAASRSAPSFVQLEEGDPIEVIGHRVTPRGSAVMSAPKTIHTGATASEGAIEEAGCKGLATGAARVSELHANFIVHDGSAKAADIVELMGRVQQRVRAHSGVWLQPEIEWWGDGDPPLPWREPPPEVARD